MTDTRLAFYRLTPAERIAAAKNAMHAMDRLAAGVTLDTLEDHELSGYICMRELDLAIAVTESIRRRDGALGRPDAVIAYLK